MVNRSGALLVRNGEVGGRPGLDVRVSSGQITEIGPGLARHDGEDVLDAAGGAVIPGLHDHHVHLRALIAARASLDVSGAGDPEAFDRQVTGAARKVSAAGWLRVTGWSEQRAGELDRHRLDTLTGGVPTRVQHRGGAQWVLNSAALRLAGVAGSSHEGIERDERGDPTGRLTRMDDWLRERLPAGLAGDWLQAELTRFSGESLDRGVTGFTDATPGREQADIDEFSALSAAAVIPQRLVLMAPPGLRAPAAELVRLGPRKVVLDDPSLPPVAELADLIVRAHRAGSHVAVHCVTADQLVVATQALTSAGPGPAGADRIEHASVVPPGYAQMLSALGVTVVTQPAFIGVRGDDYLRDVPAAEQAWLYPCESLIRAGVPVAAGSDAPFGPADPWQAIASAVTRRTLAGAVVGPGEAVRAEAALRLFTGAAQDPGRPRTVTPGQPADLCVLRGPLTVALARPGADWVLATIIGGSAFPVG